MRKFTLLALMLLIAVGVVDAKKVKAPKGPVAFNRTECDLGRVDAGTTPKVMTFEFTNTSKNPVSITDVLFQGARLEVSWLVNPTMPGAKNTVTVEWTPDYRWEDVPDQFKQMTDITICFSDGAKDFKQVLRVGGTIWLKRTEVYNRRIGRLRMHRMFPLWHYCVCGTDFPFTMQYANLTEKKMDVLIGLSDKKGTIYCELVKETLNPMQESRVEPVVGTEDMPFTHATYVAFYVNGQLQEVEPVQIIRWDKVDDPTRKAWKRARGYTYEIKGCPSKNVYDADDEAEWKRLY